MWGQPVSSWSGSYALLPAVQLCLEKKENRAGSGAADELVTLSKFSPGALDLSLVYWCICHSELCLTFLRLGVHTD